MDIKREVIVTFAMEGHHRWLEAPQEVRYLANMHRHLFHIKVAVETFHKEREVEFHTLLHQAQNAYTQGAEQSCEEIAERLLARLREMYLDRRMRVEVWEDGENGASISLDPS